MYADEYGSRSVLPGEGPLLLQDHAQLARSGVDNRRAGGLSAAREASDTPLRLRRDWLSSELEARVLENERVRPSITCVGLTLRSLMARSPNFKERGGIGHGEFCVFSGPGTSSLSVMGSRSLRPRSHAQRWR